MELPGTDRAFSKFSLVARVAARSHFHLKCRTIKADAISRARAFPVLVLAPNWPEGNGSPEMKARRHFPVICIRNERAHRVPPHLAVIACVPRYSALRRLVAPALDKRRTNPNVITRREAWFPPWNWYSTFGHSLRRFSFAEKRLEDVVRNVTNTARDQMLARTESNEQRAMAFATHN